MSANKGCDGMFLDERKIQILMAIVDDYIKNAEPVGSGTIVKRYNIGVSPATIRNEMSNLEELGLLLQPHTSAGRVPSEKAYRLYVNELMSQKQTDKTPIQDIKERLRAKMSDPDALIREIAKTISASTHYTTVVTKSKVTGFKIKYIQLIAIDQESVLLIVVINKDIVKNHIFKSNAFISQDKLDKITNVLNKNLLNHTLKEINIQMIQNIQVELGEYKNILAPILEVIANSIKCIDKADYYVAGMKNILDFPEFSNTEKARNMMQFLDESTGIFKIINEYSKEDDKIRVRIGKENYSSEAEQCSIVSGNYRISDDLHGTIAVVGPIRMDYVNTVALLDALIEQINEL